MEFEINKIIFAEKANPPKIEVAVSFKEDKQFAAQTGTLRVYLDYKDYTVSELKTEAIKAAKTFLSAVVNESTGS